MTWQFLDQLAYKLKLFSSLSLAQWALRTFGGEGKRTTPVFAFTLCYTGLGMKVHSTLADSDTAILNNCHNRYGSVTCLFTVSIS